jgi:hypothetical protein
VQSLEGVGDRSGEPGDVVAELPTKGLIDEIIMLVAHFAPPVGALGAEMQMLVPRPERQQSGRRGA